ncbi:MAG: chemotaxis-specific protein-glutamate methyltransferase CheB [Thermoanaerobaculia bacterium]
MIRVLVVDDSAFSRVTLSRMIEADPGMKVVAAAVNGEEAIRLAVSCEPDLITLDLEMPGLDGFAVLRWLGSNRPTPTVVVSSRHAREDVFRALELGAVDFIVKPQATASPEYSKLEGVLIEKLRSAAGARVVRPVVVGRLAPPEPAPLGTGVLVIGASTGGPSALSTLFSALPAIPYPIVVAQHMPPGFTRLFAQRLGRIAAFPVEEAGDGRRAKPGAAYVVPGGGHVELTGEPENARFRLFPRLSKDLYAPSVDRLFRSAADLFGARTVAVVLTGMGSDGREGVVSVRAAGGRTIAESKESAVVFGMPREAADSGAVDEVLPLGELPQALLRVLSSMGDLKLRA